jgi:hypothetical protein
MLRVKRWSQQRLIVREGETEKETNHEETKEGNEPLMISGRRQKNDTKIALTEI